MVNEGGQSLRWQRYEAKYLITESQAAEIRRHCLGHLPPDPYSLHQPGYEYPILSTYLDSPSRTLLQATLSRQVKRYKLRVRTYREFREVPDDLPAFFEIKRKIHGIVHKTRARVESELAGSLLWSRGSLLDGEEEIDAPTLANMNEFLHLRERIGADPVVGVFYTREAYEGDSADRIRVTIDRDLHYGLLAPPGNGKREMWWPASSGVVILEVKFTNTYPFWVADMLRRVEVLRRGVCKYVICSRAASPSDARASG
ncbi:MAG: polyphosphate polymerase domain-containing protein [Phycisphaerae bacterium]|nr:polyphosphate polymerase domain-containing protein [Phycisphaerae bacterium]